MRIRENIRETRFCPCSILNFLLGILWTNKENILYSKEYRIFLLAEDEGFEPPQTESESGVLPLH